MALPMIQVSGFQGSLGLELQRGAALWLIESLNKCCECSLSDELDTKDGSLQKTSPVPYCCLLMARVVGCSTGKVKAATQRHKNCKVACCNWPVDKNRKPESLWTLIDPSRVKFRHRQSTGSWEISAWAQAWQTPSSDTIQCLLAPWSPGRLTFGPDSHWDPSPHHLSLLLQWQHNYCQGNSISCPA